MVFTYMCVYVCLQYINTEYMMDVARKVWSVVGSCQDALSSDTTCITVISHFHTVWKPSSGTFQ